MAYYNTPLFIVKKNLQKSAQTGVLFSDVVTPQVLEDVCKRLTGNNQFEYRYEDNMYQDEYLEAGYNKGRLAIMLYKDFVYYISFSEQEIGGRNSSIQSVPTAYNIFFNSTIRNKIICYYFLNFVGNAETDYQILMYRLMKTIGFVFLNENVLSQQILPFNSIDDIMNSRRENASRNRGNNSSYITKSSVNNYEIYGKTYGANKYATSIMSYAVSRLALQGQGITLYEMIEGDLTELPASSLEVLSRMGNVQVVRTDYELEKTVFNNTNNLRSPHYIFNLLDRLGPKRCPLCGCEIPEIIQGAHIWPVAAIKGSGLPYVDQISHAVNGNNGLWLCENHHKLYDQGFFTICRDGKILYRNSLPSRFAAYMNAITPLQQLPGELINPEFQFYVEQRAAVGL